MLCRRVTITLQRHPLRNVVWAPRPQELINMKVSRPTWFPKDSAGGGVTNGRREGPSSSGFSRGGYMATLMAGHRKMRESKQLRDDPSASQAPQSTSGESSGR